ncbi:MAG TPA: hypothetical protein VHO43_12940 [Ignavibacteriales bacterium]|nr:hypothetical protein [Ignavibacteriales bacterium]
METYFHDLLSTGDNIVTSKYVLFNLARQKDLFITFAFCYRLKYILYSNGCGIVPMDLISSCLSFTHC